MTGPVPRQGILDIEPYMGGQSKDTSFEGKLSSNESALGPSPLAVEAYKEAADFLHRYPDGGSTALREALAETHGLDAERIVCGTGSDDLLHLLCSAYAGPGDEVLYSRHSFLIYPIAARSVGATPVQADEPNYTVSVDAMLAAVNDRTRVVFMANPNNPTGTYISTDELARLHKGLPDNVLLVVDSAYAEFVDVDDYDSGVALASDASNVVMTRTFSKIFGLAGLRLGWAYGPSDIIDVVNRLRGPFNVSGPAQAAGVAALRDTEFLARAKAHNREWRDWLTSEIESAGLRVVPSQGNFVLIGFSSTESARAADAYLRDQGIYLRQMDNYGFPDHLRLTVGTEEENQAVLARLRAFLGQNQ